MESIFHFEARLVKYLIICILMLTILAVPVSTLSTITPNCSKSTSIQSMAAAVQVSRTTFLSSSIATAALSLQGTCALAATDANLKGTKKDPAFEACLSQCMYDCTKPKGAETKLRNECLPECKQKCATTKQQLLKGTPIAPMPISSAE